MITFCLINFFYIVSAICEESWDERVEGYTHKMNKDSKLCT